MRRVNISQIRLLRYFPALWLKLKRIHLTEHWNSLYWSGKGQDCLKQTDMPWTEKQSVKIIHLGLKGDADDSAFKTQIPKRNSVWFRDVRFSPFQTSSKKMIFLSQINITPMGHPKDRVWINIWGSRTPDLQNLWGSWWPVVAVMWTRRWEVISVKGFWNSQLVKHDRFFKPYRGLSELTLYTSYLILWNTRPLS